MKHKEQLSEPKPNPQNAPAPQPNAAPQGSVVPPQGGVVPPQGRGPVPGQNMPPAEGDVFSDLKKKKKKRGWIIAIVVTAVVIGLIVWLVLTVRQAMDTLSSSVSAEPTETVATRDLIQSVGTTGTVISLETVDVAAELAGSKIEMLDVTVGDQVKAGDVLVRFDTEDLEESLTDAQEALEKTQKLNDLSKAASNASVSDTKRTTDYQIETAAESVADAEETMNNEQSKYDQLCSIYNGKQGATDEAWRVYQEALAKKDAAQKALDEAPEGAENLEELRAALEAARLEADAADKAHQAAKVISDAAADAANAQFFVLKSATKAHHDLQRSYEQTVANAQSSITSAKNSRATNELSLSTSAQEKQIDTIEEQRGISEVTAPISGIVTAVNYKAGDKYAQGPILTIQDTSAYRIRAYVSDYDIADIAVGQKVLIKTRATGNTEFEGVVSFVSPTAAPAAAGSNDASYEVRIDLREPQERLRLDMAASLSIIVDEHTGALTVPYNAVQTAEDGSTFVEVKQADGTFATVPVTVILESNYYTEVAGEGLKEGDEVRTISTTDDFDIYSELF